MTTTSEDDSPGIRPSNGMSEDVRKQPLAERLPRSPGHLQGGWADGLPDDVLLKCLAIACSGSALPTAAYAQNVCRAWRATTASSLGLLVGTLDLSYGWCRASDAAFATTCVWGRALSGICTLNLSSCSTLTDVTLERLAEGAHHLADLNLSDTKQFSFDALAAVVRACPLRCLRLARIDTKPHTTAGLDAFMDVIVRVAHLELLDLSGCARVSTSTLKRLVAGTAALRSLDLTGAAADRGVTLSLGAIGRTYPLLEVLKLNGLGGSAGWKCQAISPGLPPLFPVLRTLHVAPIAHFSNTTSGVIGGTSAITDALIAQLLAGAASLCELDVSWIAALTPTSLATVLVSCPSMQTMLCSKSGWATDEAMALLPAGAPCLVELSAEGPVITDVGVSSLAGCIRLQLVSVAGSRVTEHGVRVLVSNAPDLRRLGIAGCRGVGRAVRAEAERAGPHRLRLTLGREKDV